TGHPVPWDLTYGRHRSCDQRLVTRWWYLRSKFCDEPRSCRSESHQGNPDWGRVGARLSLSPDGAFGGVHAAVSFGLCLHARSDNRLVIWQLVLTSPNIGIDEDFFERGAVVSEDFYLVPTVEPLAEFMSPSGSFATFLVRDFTSRCITV